MNKPTVLVITPSYNCARFVNETIHSVLSQNYKNIKYMVIDDASTDNPQYPDTYDNDYTLIRHLRNKGEQRTVNEGLLLAKGKYFMVVNADDPLLPGAINTLVEFMEANPDVLCGYPDWDSIDESSRFRCHITSREYDFTWMVKHHTWLPSVGSIFHSDVIKLIGLRDRSFQWLGDADYWLRVGLAGKMARVPYTLACWRHRNGQASLQKSSLRAGEHIRIMRKFYSTPNLPRDIIKVKNEAICWSDLVATAVTDNKLEVVKYLFKAIMTYPRLIVSLEFWDLLIKRAYFILLR